MEPLAHAKYLGFILTIKFGFVPNQQIIIIILTLTLILKLQL